MEIWERQRVIAGGEAHSLALKIDGSIVAWGWDDSKQVGDTPAGADFVQVAGGYRHSLALKLDGSIVAWGYDDWYPTVSDTPAGTDFVQVAAGYYHSLALKSDGSIVSWGQDDYNQVTDTPTTSDFAQVAGGGYHSLALKSDGSIVSWGYDYSGQVSGTPAGTDFVQVAAGNESSLALKADGSIVSWGYGGYDLISDAPTTSDFTQVDGGTWHSLALKSDGSIVSWGRDNYNAVRNTPSGTDFVQVAAGGHHSLALKSDGSLVSWGDDDYNVVSGTPTTSDFWVFSSGKQEIVEELQVNIPINISLIDVWVLSLIIVGSVLVNSEMDSKRKKVLETGKIKTNIFLPPSQKLIGSIKVNTKLGRKSHRVSVKTAGVLLSSDYERICYGPDVIISMKNMMTTSGEWVVADNLEEDISIWVSFPEPEYVPAYLVSGQKKHKKQTFEMKVRKSIDNKVDPVIQIYYYSNGMPISKSRKIKIISTKGQIVKWHWFIESNFEKKHVQCKVSSSSYNYGPVNKCGVDIDYITWCGVYDLLANP